jgi:DNA-binding NarL/FixJ family response regulator
MPDPRPDADGPIRVLLVDADDRVRESLTGLVAIGGRVTVVGSAGQPGRALELVADTHPDVVMVDPRLPDLDGGTAFIADVRVMAPEVRILAMSWSDSLERAALDGGADGFVRKTFRPTELVAAIIAAGRRTTA